VAGKTLQAAGVLESPAGGTTSAALQAPVLARDGTLVVGTDLQMSGFGAGFPGTAKWSFAPSATSDAPLLAVGVAPDGTLLGTWSDLPVYAVSVSGSGTVASESNAPAGTLVGGLGHVYAWSKTGISVIDGATSGTSSIVGVALQSDAVVVMYNHGKQGGVGAYLALLDPASLATNGTAAVIEAEIASPPVVDADDSVYFLTVDGRLHVRKANSNQSFDAGAPASTFPAPIIGNGAVYLGGIAGGGVCVYR
jgi:hypothetical protein